MEHAGENKSYAYTQQTANHTHEEPKTRQR